MEQSLTKNIIAVAGQMPFDLLEFFTGSKSVYAAFPSKSGVTYVRHIFSEMRRIGFANPVPTLRSALHHARFTTQKVPAALAAADGATKVSLALPLLSFEGALAALGAFSTSNWFTGIAAFFAGCAFFIRTLFVVPCQFFLGGLSSIFVPVLNFIFTGEILSLEQWGKVFKSFISWNFYSGFFGYLLYCTLLPIVGFFSLFKVADLNSYLVNMQSFWSSFTTATSPLQFFGLLPTLAQVSGITNFGSTLSLVLGAIFVTVLGYLLYLFFQQQSSETEEDVAVQS